jgi:hypothetical protein
MRTKRLFFKRRKTKKNGGAAMTNVDSSRRSSTRVRSPPKPLPQPIHQANSRKKSPPKPPAMSKSPPRRASMTNNSHSDSSILKEIKDIAAPLFETIKDIESETRIDDIRTGVGEICDWYMNQRGFKISDTQRTVIKMAVGMIIVKHAVCEQTNMGTDSSTCSKPSKACAIERGALSEAMSTNRDNLIAFWEGRLGKNVLKVCFDKKNDKDVEGLIPYTDVETTTLKPTEGLVFEASHWLQAAFSESGAGESKTFFEYDSPNIILALQGAAQLSKKAGDGPGHSFCGSIATNNCHYNYYRKDGYSALPDASILYQCGLVESMVIFLYKKKYKDDVLQQHIDSFEEDARKVYIEDAIVSTFFEIVLNFEKVKERRKVASFTQAYTDPTNRSGHIIQLFCSGDSSNIAEIATSVFFKRLSVEHVVKAIGVLLEKEANANGRQRHFVKGVIGTTSVLTAIGKRLQSNIKDEYDSITVDSVITSGNVYSSEILSHIKDTLSEPLREKIDKSLVVNLKGVLQTQLDDSYKDVLKKLEAAEARAEAASANAEASRANSERHKQKAAESKASEEVERKKSELLQIQIDELMKKQEQLTEKYVELQQAALETQSIDKTESIEEKMLKISGRIAELDKSLHSLRLKKMEADKILWNMLPANVDKFRNEHFTAAKNVVQKEENVLKEEIEKYEKEIELLRLQSQSKNISFKKKIELEKSARNKNNKRINLMEQVSFFKNKLENNEKNTKKRRTGKLPTNRKQMTNE